MFLNQRLDPSALEVLWDAVEPEGEVRFWLPGDDLGNMVGVPNVWSEAIRQSVDPAEFIRHWWAPVAALLPRTIELLQRHTSSLLVLSTSTRPVSLLYCFGTDKGLYAQRGFIPCTGQAAETLCQAHLPVDLLSFYRVHDGFVDFFSGDGGPLPVDQWRTSREAGAAPFLEVYVNGSTAAGFDTSVQPMIPYNLLPDEDVVMPIEDFWVWLDGELSENLEDV